MNPLRWPDKDPADVWDFTLDARAWMSAVSDTLGSVTATVAPSGLTVQSTAVTADGLATLRLSGGAAGTDYLVTMTLATDGGRTLQRSVQIRVEEL